MAKKKTVTRRPRRRASSNFASRARSAGRNAAAGLKESAIAGGTGAGSYFLHKMVSQKVPALNSSPFIMPALLFAGGHFVKRKNAAIGNGLLGASGYALGMAIDVNRMNQQAAANKAASDTKAFLEPSDITQEDTRALLQPAEITMRDTREFEDSLDYSEAMGL